ncbi:MAG: hypothetical protein ACLUOI_19365 [Eisenbergiella sp.]
MKLELKKTNIKPIFRYCRIRADVHHIALPHLIQECSPVPLEGTRQSVMRRFSLSILALMGVHLTEYCGGAILLFSYPINRKSVVWAKAAVILLFISTAMFLTEYGGFLIFIGTDSVLQMVNDTLVPGDFMLAFRNALVLVCLADGIALCAIRIGFIKKSNSVTIISAVILSMLLINPVAAINEQFLPVLFLAAAALIGGILLILNVSHKVKRMEI